ncbi:MAG: ATP-binding protein [Dehalococcoidia bacterium]
MPDASTYQALMRDSPVGHVLYDTAGRYVYVNPVVEQILGRSSAELLQRPAAEVVPDLWPQLEPAFRHVIETRERIEFDVVGEAPAEPGRRHHWLVEYFPVFGPDGTLMGVAGTSIDRTEARRAQADLARREQQQEATAQLGLHALEDRDLGRLMDEAVERLASTLEVDFARVMELTPDGRSLLLRAGVGWRPGLVGHTTVPIDSDSHVRFALEARTAVTFDDLDAEARFSRPPLLLDHEVASGISVPIVIYHEPYGLVGVYSREPRIFTQDDANFLQGIANVLASAIERARSEEAIRYFSRVGVELASSLDLEATIDVVRRLAVPELADVCEVHLSAEVAATAGVEPDRFLVADTVPRTPSTYADLGAALGPSDPNRGDVERLRKAGFSSGTILPMEARGRNLGYIALASKERRLYRRRTVIAGGLASRASLAIDNALLFEQAESASRLRETFISVASHELRSPLSNLIGFADLLAMQIEAEPEQFGSDIAMEVATLQAEASRMRRTLELFLSLSQLEHGTISLAPGPVHLEELLADEVAEVRLAHPGVELEERYPSSARLVVTDGERVREIVQNLLDNAVKYGGASGRIELGLAYDDGQAVISVRDHGPGIPAADQAHLFERFFRGGGAKRPQGTGLGLYVCQLMARELGGAIEFESEEGRGTEFRLLLGTEVEPG